ncbi:MAG: AbrB/MazE/SpoVT family DNA-binding domain-containing protein [Spirochaeta sp.]|jgi:antitoxin PrlF|nr:AbrB/MazE/SpoVT family DNA-binding domain-containing protein [Spirochaeta sp.]
MKTVVSERGQITLPKAIRTAMGIRAGTILDVAIEDGRITVWKREETDPVHLWRGKGVRPAGVSSTDEYLAMVRD